MVDNRPCRALAAFVLSLSSALWAQSAASVAILPYSSPDPAVANRFSYALYAVPDLLREQLMADARFSVVERRRVDEAIAAGPRLDAGLADEEGRRSIAAACGSDYYVWGYILESAEGLRVFHLFSETESGRTLHASTLVLPEGPGLIDRMADSVLDLYRWTQAELPALAEKPPEEKTVVVEKTVIVEKPVIVERTIVVTEREEVVRRLGLSLSPSLGYLLFPWTFRNDLKPVPAAGLAVAWAPRGSAAFEAGLDLRFTKLENADRAGVSAIDVVMLPVLAEAALLWEPLEGFGLRLSAGGGFSLIFGRVNSEYMNYLKPLASAGVDARWLPSPGLSIGVGVRLAYGFGFYAGRDMIYLAPGLTASLRF
jgi:hypothetical protein